MARSVCVKKLSNDSILLKVNKTEMTTILSLSLLAEVSFYSYLVRNIIPATKKEKTSMLAFFILLILSLVFIAMVCYSVNNFLKEKNYLLEKKHAKLFINGAYFSEESKVKVQIEDYVNRYGTQTFSILLSGNNMKKKIVRGVNKSDKDYLLNWLVTFFSKNAIIKSLG